jgi:peptidoglycan/LPS O-acetylase OafA/YrhL
MRHRGLRYMPALDGLRALAVLAVLLYHGNVSWAQGGYFGVDAFFVLSGFLITGLLLAEWRDEGGINFKQFWVRRARRLLPALALVVVAVAVYAARYAMPIELHQLRRDALSTIGYVANWSQIFAHQSYFEQFAAPSALKHTWSLAIEEQFYLVWPLLVFAAMRLGRGSKKVLLGGCLVLASLAPSFTTKASTGVPSNLTLARPYNNLSIGGCAIGDFLRAKRPADTKGGACGAGTRPRRNGWAGATRPNSASGPRGLEEKDEG